MPKPFTLVLSCEHGGKRIPRRWRALFRGQTARLDSHYGHDIGALGCARVLARGLRAPLLAAETSRLLVDLNRSPHHRALFSDVTRALPAAERAMILARHYHPHRERVERLVAGKIANGARVLHVAVHSFTPQLDGVVRNADIALLYDPARPAERELCRSWQRILQRDSGLAIRRNYPYRGIDDGLTRWLRTRFGRGAYAGVEIEINQRLLARRRAGAVHSLLLSSLRETLRRA